MPQWCVACPQSAFITNQMWIGKKQPQKGNIEVKQFDNIIGIPYKMVILEEKD